MILHATLTFFPFRKQDYVEQPLLQGVVVWVVMSYGLEKARCFGSSACRLFVLISCLLYSSTLNVAAITSAELHSVTTQKTVFSIAIAVRT
jgi:hypothetical protein